MASPVVRLSFSDGRTEDVILNPRAIIEAERKYGTIPPVEGTLYGAWIRLGRPGGFDEWLDTIEAMEQAEVEPPRPTKPAASAGS